MKFTTTNNKRYRAGVGYVPKPWLEYPDLNYLDSINEYFEDNIKLYDFDFCGNETHDFIFEDGKAFRLEYTWWRNDFAEEDESVINDEIEIEEISIEDANVPEKEMKRDWF